MLSIKDWPVKWHESSSFHTYKRAYWRSAARELISFSRQIVFAVLLTFFWSHNFRQIYDFKFVLNEKKNLFSFLS